MNWDDLRYVLAVARAGSALRAAEALHVNQTTVLRRLSALETALGAPLFERRRSGQALTEIGRLVADAAARMEAEAQALTNTLAAHERALVGAVRVTASESLAALVLAPSLPVFQQLHPGVTVELIAADRRLDIARGEADMALRAGSRPEGAGIVARRLPDAHWTVYCSRAYAEKNGAPRNREDIPGHAIVGMEGRMAKLPAYLWLLAAAPDTVVRFRSNSLMTLVLKLKADLGLGALPTLIGDAEPALMRCFAPPPELAAELWLIVREDIKARPHVRAFADFIAGQMREKALASAHADSC